MSNILVSNAQHGRATHSGNRGAYQRSTSGTASIEILGGCKDDVILDSQAGSVLDRRWILAILSFLLGFVLFWRRNTDVLDVWIIFGSVDTLLEQCNSTLQFINLGLKISNICCNLFENTLLVFFLAVCLKFRVNKFF